MFIGSQPAPKERMRLMRLGGPAVAQHADHGLDHGAGFDRYQEVVLGDRLAKRWLSSRQSSKMAAGIVSHA
jgi:hypothetical protein